MSIDTTLYSYWSNKTYNNTFVLICTTMHAIQKLSLKTTHHKAHNSPWALHSTGFCLLIMWPVKFGGWIRWVDKALTHCWYNSYFCNPAWKHAKWTNPGDKKTTTSRTSNAPELHIDDKVSDELGLLHRIRISQSGSAQSKLWQMRLVDLNYPKTADNSGGRER